MTFLSSAVNFLITPAFADTTAASVNAAPQSGGMSLVVMTVIFVLFMYLVMWRPQSKRAKEHRSLLSSLTKNDEIVTAGGIAGKITKVTDDYILLEVADKVEMLVQKGSVSSVLPKGTLNQLAK